MRSGDLALGAGDPRLSFCTVDTWVLWNLTGGPAGGVYATDPSNASRTLLLDTAALAWSAELCELFGVPLPTLPEVRPSAGRFGTASLAGLGPASDVLDGVPVSGVLGDQQAALFGQACFEPGMVKVTYGTGSFALANAGAERPAAPEGLTVSCAWDLGGHADGAHGCVAYALEGSAFVSGAAIQWLRDGLGIISSAEEVGPLAASVPDSGGVTFVPALTGLGSPWWDPQARGIVTGLTRGAGRPQLARACVEAMAFQVRDMTDAMAAASAHPLSALRADGGAAAMDLLLELQAEQSRMPVARPRSLESTALGAATVAGLAEGMWSSLSELAGALGGRPHLRAAAAGRPRRRGARRLAPRRREVDGLGGHRAGLAPPGGTAHECCVCGLALPLPVRGPTEQTEGEHCEAWANGVALRSTDAGRASWFVAIRFRGAHAAESTGTRSGSRRSRGRPRGGGREPGDLRRHRHRRRTRGRHGARLQ